MPIKPINKNKNNEVMPNWFDKSIKKENLSEEEKKEIDDFIKEYV